jgi:hypothetical protein
MSQVLGPMLIALGIGFCLLVLLLLWLFRDLLGR